MADSRSLRSIRRERVTTISNGQNGEACQGSDPKIDEKRPKHSDGLFDFDTYLRNRIPDTYSIWIVNDLPSEEKREEAEPKPESAKSTEEGSGDVDIHEDGGANETVKAEPKNIESSFRLFDLHKHDITKEMDEKITKTLKLPTKLIDFSDPTTLLVEEDDSTETLNGDAIEGAAVHKKRRAARRTVVTQTNMTNKEAQLKRKEDDRRRKIADPLDDSLFSLYHKRREKGEKKMGNVDKTTVMIEYDNYFEQLRRLGEKAKKKGISADDRHLASTDPTTRYYSLDDVPRGVLETLFSMTKISDVHNGEEVLMKLRLTIREIKQFIMKFEELRSKEAGLKKEIAGYVTQSLNKQMGYSNGEIPVVYLDPKMSKKRQKAALERVMESEEFIDTDSDDPQESLLNLSKLRRRRVAKRAEKYGKIITIKLLDGVSIVIDPIFPPKVTRD